LHQIPGIISSETSSYTSFTKNEAKPALSVTTARQEEAVS
jgi:hypothetical protein